MLVDGVVVLPDGSAVESVAEAFAFVFASLVSDLILADVIDDCMIVDRLELKTTNPRIIPARTMIFNFPVR